MTAELWRNFKKTTKGKALRHAVYMRDSYTCVYCGKVGAQLTIDHIIARANGGDIYDPCNMVTCCASCNSKKGAKSLVDFIEYAGLSYTTLGKVAAQSNSKIALDIA